MEAETCIQGRDWLLAGREERGCCSSPSAKRGGKSGCIGEGAGQATSFEEWVEAVVGERERQAMRSIEKGKESVRRI
jgi:hypothetical protein